PRGPDRVPGQGAARRRVEVADHPARRVGRLQQEPRARKAARRVGGRGTEAQRLAAEAHDLRQDGRLAEAEERYRAALAAADPRHGWTPEHHAEDRALEG